MILRTILLILTIIPLALQAQYGYITGQISDRFGPLPNVAVSIKDSPYATFTDEAGYFAFEIDTGYHELRLELTGYHAVDRTIELDNLEQQDLDLEMESALMDADVSIGSKSTVTQNQLESPVPIDVIYGKDLVSTGQVELAAALHQLQPSFYAVRQSADDGVNVVTPISLRGLGPDQVLVLINGKRRHKSAFLNVSNVFGKGTATTDLNTIPILAIDRIEVLRDGASSQYGSDAIAGVINIVLKERSSSTSISALGGSTTEGDGVTSNLEFNFGTNIQRRGFLNLTGSFVQQNEVNRGGAYTGPIVGIDSLDRSPVARQFFFDQTGFPNNTIYELGSSKTENASLILNSSLELTEDWDLYTVGTLNFRDGKVNQLYRLPFSDEQVVRAYNPFGFSPQLILEVVDRSFATGVRGTINDWYLDIGYALGRNNFDVSVRNSNNASLGLESPPGAFAGAYNYGHDILSLDLSRSLLLPFGEIDFAFGAEYRSEQYEIEAGELESYVFGEDTTAMGELKSPGIQGYTGIRDEDELLEVRSNAAAYGELDYSVGNLLLSGAVRYEEYSDFGENISYKVAGRYKFANQFLLRTSYNTGFKAPSLQQIFYQRLSNELIDDGFENVLVINGSNFLGSLLQQFVGGFEPEISESVSMGFTSSINRNISLSVDAYETLIEDRIGLLSRFRVEGDEELEEPLRGSGIDFIELFTNIADTRTRGVDAVLAAQYYFANWSLNINTGASFIRTEITEFRDNDETLLERSEQARFETYVPSYQWRNNISVTFKRFTITAIHTRYGETEFLFPGDDNPENWAFNSFTGQLESRDQQFGAKDILSADLKFNILPGLDMTVGALNLTNQFPDRMQHSDNTNLGVTPYSLNVRPFDLRGTYLYSRINFRL